MVTHIIIALVAFIVGAIAATLAMVWHGHEVLIKATPFFRELVIRGDAAIAMLSHTALDKVAKTNDRNRRVVLASDMAQATKGNIVQEG